MGCNCTANLRADIIKRFFANDARRHEFALELIRIVECQQTVMSLDLQEWFRIYFGFSDILFEEFLACVMKRQTTMSAELQKVIRSRYFPTSQQMALDFIRVVLCSCCPAICGTDIDIVGIYQGDPVADGWYLRQGAGASAEVAEIVYIESDTITESRVCDSRIADYGHPNGINGGYEAPHYYNSGGDWLPMLEVGLKDLGSNDYEFTIWGADPFPYDIAGSTILVQYSTDGGTTWIDGGTADGTSLGGTFIPVTFNTGTNTFIYRTIVTLANGCQFYNPAPDGSNAPVTYFILDDQFLSQFIGWTFNGTDLLDFRNNVLPTLPNFLLDSSADGAGDSLYVAFSGVNHPNIVVVDAVSDPITLDWTTLIAKIPCLSATFTVNDPSDTTLQTLNIGSYIIAATAIAFTDPSFVSVIQAQMRGNGFGSLTTVEINIVGNDVTITFRNSNGLVTGISWVDSAMNTGDETLTTCI